VSETPAPVATVPETPAPAASTSTIELKPIPKYKPAEDCDSYNFAVAGVYYHQDEIIEGLMEENPEYELTKKEIKESNGHAIVFVGYDDSRQVVEFRNSWSNQWANNGYAYMTYDVLKKVMWWDDTYAIVR
jgi:C1A family cysteine protease